MNILITGGLGYIGSHVAQCLSQAGNQVILLSRKPQVPPLQAKFFTTFLTSPIIKLNCDIRNTIKLVECFQRYSIELVVHCAGNKTVSVDCKSQNMIGTQSVLSAMQQAQVHKLIFTSSAAVYGNTTTIPISESHSLFPVNAYGCSKVLVESLFPTFIEINPLNKIICLRLFNVAGAAESHLWGEFPTNQGQSLVSRIGMTLFKKELTINIVGGELSNPDGTLIRDYLHVLDVAEGVLAAVLVLQETTPLNLLVVNLGSGKGYSSLQLLNIFKEICGVNIPVQICKRNTEVLISVAAIDKAQELLHWKPTRNLVDICRSSWEWQQKCCKQHKF